VVIIFFLLKKELFLVFFNIMTQLFLHVVDELNLCGLIHNCWVYLVE